MFCLESPKVRWKLGRGLKRRILSFFILWHAHELEDMLRVFNQKCFFFFFFFCFQFGFFQVRSLYVCVCVCVFFFCIPHLSGVMNLCRDKNDEMYITRSIVMFQERVWPLVVIFLPMIPFCTHLLNASPVCLS